MARMKAALPHVQSTVAPLLTGASILAGFTAISLGVNQCLHVFLPFSLLQN